MRRRKGRVARTSSFQNVRIALPSSQRMSSLVVSPILSSTEANGWSGDEWKLRRTIAGERDEASWERRKMTRQYRFASPQVAQRCPKAIRLT